MRFMVLVKATKDSEAGVMPSEEMLGAMGKFNEEMVKAGVMLDGNGLQPSSKGARVRFAGNKRTVIDGPFAETKELVAGYWIIQVKSQGRGHRMDQALPQSAQRGWRDRDPPAVRARGLRRQRGGRPPPRARPTSSPREVNSARMRLARAAARLSQIEKEMTMRFMSMVKSSEDHRSGPPPQALMEAMDKLGQEMTKAGVMVDMGGLLPTAMGAYRVRLSGGKLSVTDGPFSEAKEVIGGYAVFDVQIEGGSHGADHASSWTSTGSTGPSGKARPRSGRCSMAPAALRILACTSQPCCVVADCHAMIGCAARLSLHPKERIMKMAAHATHDLPVVRHRSRTGGEFLRFDFRGCKDRKDRSLRKGGQEIHGKEAGSVMTVEFEIAGQTFVGLNGGPHFKFNEAVSFQVHCETQQEIDYFWGKLSKGGEEGPCGWLKDKYGVSWQVVPTVLPKMLSDADAQKSQRVTKAFLQMKKFDIGELQRAYDGARP